MAEEQPVTTEVTPPPTQSTLPTPTPAPAGATNGLAIAAMVVGIVAFISGWIPFWGLLAGAAAVVLGVLALKKPTGKGMSITGIVTGGLAALTSLIFTVLFIITLAAGSAIVNEAHNQAQQESAKTQDLIDAKKDFSQGETAVFGTLEVKINSVERNYAPESSFYQPEDGNEYIVLNVTVKNVGDENEYVSPYSFTVNDNGIAVDGALVPVDSELESGDLSPGASTTGNIVYEVTKDASNLKLQHEVTVFTPQYESKTLVYTLAI